MKNRTVFHNISESNHTIHTNTKKFSKQERLYCPYLSL